MPWSSTIALAVCGLHPRSSKLLSCLPALSIFPFLSLSLSYFSMKGYYIHCLKRFRYLLGFHAGLPFKVVILVGVCPNIIPITPQYSYYFGFSVDIGWCLPKYHSDHSPIFLLLWIVPLTVKMFSSKSLFHSYGLLTDWSNSQ